MTSYQTHQPLLFACARHAIETRGDIIELGCGLHSTMQLEAMCWGASVFRSYETDRGWAAEVRRFGVRSLVEVEGYDDVPIKPYAMVFIDNAPAMRRKMDLLRFMESHLVVVHDTDAEHSNIYGMGMALAAYPYRFDHRRMKPNTTVVSRDAGAIRRIREIFE